MTIVILLILTSPAHAAEPVIGKPAPALQATELDGTAFDLGAMKGKVAIVHFWATWCPSCREEMHVLAHFYRVYHARGIEIIGVSVDRANKRDEVKVFMQPFGFPAALLGDSKSGFGFPSSIPVTYVIDGEGIVRAKLTLENGELTEKSLEDAVGPLLKR